MTSRDVRMSPQDNLKFCLAICGPHSSLLGYLGGILVPTRKVLSGAQAGFFEFLHRVAEVTVMIEAQRTCDNATQGAGRMAYRRHRLWQRYEQDIDDLVEGRPLH